MLAEHLLERITAGRPFSLTSQALEYLQQHDWPGNVRELLHTLERAYLVGSGQITAELLAVDATDRSVPQTTVGARHAVPTAQGFQAVIDRAERELLQGALRDSLGNKTAAAAALGMKPSTFRDKLAKHGLG